jgi:hypothetical protein
MAAKPDGYVGFRGNAGDGSEINALRFVMQSVLSEVATSMVVKVAGVRSNGEVAPPGTIDVVPVVHQIDGMGNTHPHGTIFNVPYHRPQNGTNGIIMDPKAGDVGVIVCASRDISSVKANKGDASAPGSFRRHDLADALYVGTVIAKGAPGQYMQFTDDGLTLVSPGTITIRAPAIVFEGDVTWVGNQAGGRGTMTINMDIAQTGTITSNSKHIDSSHVHGNVLPGGASTSPPVN